jgi:CheY-like chemotaxis protein
LEDSGIATRRIKPDPERQAIPIIGVMAYSLRAEETKAGAAAVLTKYVCSISVVLSRGTGQ